MLEQNDTLPPCPLLIGFFYNAFGSPLMLHFFHYNAQYCLSYTCTEAFLMFIVNNKVSKLMFFIDQKIMVETAL